jgi:hypothetical protein
MYVYVCNTMYAYIYLYMLCIFDLKKYIYYLKKHDFFLYVMLLLFCVLFNYVTGLSLQLYKL